MNMMWCMLPGLMPIPGGLPPLPNLPNLNLPLPDLSAVSLAGTGTLSAAAGTTGEWTHTPSSDCASACRSFNFFSHVHDCKWSVMTSVNICVLSPTSGSTAAPEPAGSRHVSPPARHAALPAAAPALSGCDPPYAHLHSSPSSVGHSVSSTCDPPSHQHHSPHRSWLHKRHGIASPHGNDTDIIVMWRGWVLLPANFKTPGFSLSTLPICLSVFFYLLAERAGRRMQQFRPSHWWESLWRSYEGLKTVVDRSV